MPGEESVTTWIEQLRSGNSEAAQRLWDRYYFQLVQLARRKLADTPRRAMDEEDVVQNAFRSFFRRAEKGQFPRLDDRDDLWQILVMITVRKASNQRRDQFRAKRGAGKVSGESAFGQSDTDRCGLDQVAGEEPTPQFAAQVVEQLQLLLKRLGDATLQSIAIQKLEGWTNREIAGHFDCSLSAVERKLRLIRRRLSEQPID
jgi:RNA polymerase sigma factor (sigma-70 family)